MIAVRTRFDGSRIATPPELTGLPPGDVVIVYEPASSPSTVATGQTSAWDAIGKAPQQRTAADIQAQIDVERQSWGER